MTTYAAHDDTAVYYTSTNPETILDEAARDCGYADHATMQADGNTGFQIARINPDWAAEIERDGWRQGTIFDVVGGEIIRISEQEHDELHEALFGPSTWTDHTVLLEDGTTGMVRIPADQDPETLVGETATVNLHDENGLHIQATGIVAEILE